MIKKAMILAAGFGKRLNPLTLNIPKPLLKIGKETLLSNTINFLENYGTKELVINVQYVAMNIIEYLIKKKDPLILPPDYEKLPLPESKKTTNKESSNI